MGRGGGSEVKGSAWMRGPQGRGRCQVSLGAFGFKVMGHEGQGSAGPGGVGGIIREHKGSPKHQWLAQGQNQNLGDTKMTVGLQGE